MFEELEIKNKELTIYHRTTLSIEEKDKSFYKYLQKYGLINPRNEEERNKNYLKSGIYFNSVLTNNNNYNKHYGKWILKGFCNISNFFIIDFLFYKTFFNPNSTQDKYLGEQFSLFGHNFNQNKIKPIWIYTNQYYKIYRVIEKDIDKIWDKLEFRCKEFIFEKYLEFIKHFSKQKNISILNFKNTYGYEFNPAIYDKSIHKDLENIYSKMDIYEIKELYKILPIKFKLKEFNPGISILEKYL